VDHLDVGIEHRRHPRLLREPKADQDSGNRTDDEGEHGFDERDPQMLPDRASTSHLTMRAATSAGVEKKNGGRSFTPPMGTVVQSCQSNTVTSATRNWNARSLGRDTRKNLRGHHPRRRMIQ